MTRIERIKNSLKILDPKYLKIIDQTIDHIGHLKNSNDSETHLSIDIWSDLFLDKTKLEQHRMINDIILGEFDKGLHALTINIKRI